MEARIHTRSCNLTSFSIIQESLRIELICHQSYTISESVTGQGNGIFQLPKFKSKVLKSKAKGGIYPITTAIDWESGRDSFPKEKMFLSEKRKVHFRETKPMDIYYSRLHDLFVFSSWFRHEWIWSLLSIDKVYPLGTYVSVSLFVLPVSSFIKLFLSPQFWGQWTSGCKTWKERQSAKGGKGFYSSVSSSQLCPL